MQLFRAWCNLLVEGAKGYYSSYAGKVYLEQRIGGPLDPAAIAEFQTLIQSVMKLSGKTQLNWLDLGCGNGRHLAHIHKHMPNISAQGIELSQLGYAKCKELMDAEKLPKDSVIMADMRKIPLAGDTFDVVFARMSLHCLPYIPNSGLGMEEAFEEIRRVLKPGGIAALQFPNGHWRDYSMPRQFMNQDSVKAIAQSCKLEVVEIAQVMEEPTTSTDGSYIPSTMKFTYGQSLRVLLRK
ncbi:MAG: hypothetical protein DI585_02935 [Pseudomonas fluorescens]|nr:MAG: hypothetical protein DI585_02935 [Pseudomonas fluorescens]